MCFNELYELFNPYITVTHMMYSYYFCILYNYDYACVVLFLARYLDYAMDETKVRSQDFFTVIRYIGGNPAGRGLVWDFIRKNWEALVAR